MSTEFCFVIKNRRKSQSFLTLLHYMYEQSLIFLRVTLEYENKCDFDARSRACPPARLTRRKMRDYLKSTTPEFGQRNEETSDI